MVDSRALARVTMTKKKRIDTSSPKASSSNPFAGLAGLRDSLPGEETAPAPDVAEPEEKKAPVANRPRRAVVRYSRKSRGGKEVSVVEQLGLPTDVLTSWLQELKKVLGVGGYIEGDKIVLAGDQRSRLPGLLTERGVAKITIS